MGKVEVWQLEESGSENDHYEESEFSSYQPTDESSDYEEENRPVDLFDIDHSRRRFRKDSDSEDRRVDQDDLSEEGVDDGSDVQTDYSTAEEVADGDAYLNEWKSLQYVRAYGKAANDFYYNFDIVPRYWNAVFYITTIHNLETVPQNYFYFIQIARNNPNASSRYCKKIYTPLYTLGAGERLTLKLPIFICNKSQMVIPYGEFKDYILKIDLWKKHRLSVNTLHATCSLTFQDIIENKSNMTLSLNRVVSKLTSSEENEPEIITEESERKIPIHRLNVVFLLEELFDFVFDFQNWWFTPSEQLPEYLKKAPKDIKVSVIKQIGRGWDNRWAGISYDDYWPSAGRFTYRGTIRQMKISYFQVKVYCIINKRFWNKSTTLLGTCVMSLKSVSEYPLVRGTVKKLGKGADQMQSGTIQGNIMCLMKSANLDYFEEIKNRPAQPISGSSLLTHLDKSCRYLVIRLLRCENLPATNTDTNSSDPLVKVRWDGIVNFTTTLESTTSPVYNQNMYFPIHLVDEKETINPFFIINCLPVDLSSKGPVIMEVWDSDDTSSEFLGGVEVSLSKLYTDGRLYSRSLVDGIYNEASKQPLGDDEYHDQGDLVLYSGFSNDVDVQHITQLYNDTLTLTGYTVPHRGSKPTITFEMYILPPMPDGLYIPNDQKRQVKSDTYRDLSKRWDKDFEVWQKMYRDQTLSNFPHRRFLCTTANNALTRDVFPSEIIVLCSFLTPIQVSSHLSSPGNLMHWISNFGLKDDAVERLGDLSKIENWQNPSRFLTTRKGGLHDRALLLCSCLLGLNFDAYVCKGTIKNGSVEHCWVMTRHSDSTVSFWETGNKKIWHLPKRWKLAKHDTSLYEDLNAPSAPLLDNYQNVHFDPLSNFQQSHLPQTDGHGLTKYEMYGDEYIPDQKVDLNSLLYKHDAVNFHSSEFASNINKTLVDNPQKKQFFEKTFKQIKPKQELVVPFETLVHLPYSSIETVFNNKQLWGNIQNHHPSCILYDLEEPTQWKPFLKVPLQDEFLSNIQITAPPTDYKCNETSKDITNDICDMIEVMRAQRGLKCSISKDIQMHERLEDFLDIMDFRERLDPQFDPGMPPNLLGWSNRKKMKKLMKSKNAQEMFSEMNKTTIQYCDPYSSTESTDASPQNEKCDVKDKKSEDDEEEDNVTPDDEPVEPESEKEEKVENKSQKTRDLRSRSRSRRRRKKLEKKSKPIKKKKSKDPIHKTCMQYKVKTVRLKTNGFQINGSRGRKRVLRINKPIDDEIYKTLGDVLHLDIPEFKICSKFDPIKTPSSLGLSKTPMSDLTNNFETKSFNRHSEIIRSAVHKMRFPPQNVYGNRFNSNRGSKHVKLVNYMNQGNFLLKGKKGLLKRLSSTVKKLVPKYPKNSRFVEDMSQVVPMPVYYKEYMYTNYNIPYEFKLHESKEVSMWYWYYNNEAILYSWQKYLPVLANHTFIGIPIHFSTSDVNEIRRLLCCNKRFKKLLVNKLDDIVYVIHSKVYPLLGNLFSTWVFIGCHVPWRI